MKKLSKFLGIMIVAALAVFTPATLSLAATVTNISTASTTFHYTAPGQADHIFQEASLGDYSFTGWQSEVSDNLITSTVTKRNNEQFRNSHPDAFTIATEKLDNRAPIVMTREVRNIPVNGHYQKDDINLAANGYYRFSVWYYAIGETSYFYLTNDEDEYEIALPVNNAWHCSSFYVRTDRLTAATFNVSLYLGAKNHYVHGAIYYDDFTVTALRAQDFATAIADLDYDEQYINLTNTTDCQDPALRTFQADEFQAEIPEGDAKSITSISTTEVPTRLNFADCDYFYHHSGTETNVMLLAANQATATIKVVSNDDFAFHPTLNAVYMFQFYSLASPDTDSFYFKVGNVYHTIKNVTYEYYNQWQLNTIFYIGGNQDEDYDLSFCLGGYDNKTTTGWVAIDGTSLAIYQVAGSYATDHADALGVHDTKDLNNTDDDSTIKNGNFNAGVASDLNLASYPYPLKAKENWTTNSTTNGIVNTNHWIGLDVANPGAIQTNLNNNIYMLRNYQRTTNTLTTPDLSTSTEDKTYFGFDAYADTTVNATATFMTDDLVLGTINFNDGGWRHYQFEITENAYTATRTYKIVFTLTSVGAVFIDNVTTGNNAKAGTIIKQINLSNPLTLTNIWSADNDNFVAVTDQNGLSLRNNDLHTATVKNGLAYQLTAGYYYQITVAAYGQNVTLALDGFEGALTINDNFDFTPDCRTYQLYLAATSSDATNLNITLGNFDDEHNFQAGLIYLQQFDFSKIEEDVYNLAVKQADEDAYTQILTAANADETDDDTNDNKSEKTDFNFFGENWWYLIPTLITAIAALLAVICFFVRKIKFDKHITKKTTSYARDMKIKTTHKKIVAEHSAKVDNVTDESQSN